MQLIDEKEFAKLKAGSSTSAVKGVACSGKAEKECRDHQTERM